MALEAAGYKWHYALLKVKTRNDDDDIDDQCNNLSSILPLKNLLEK